LTSTAALLGAAAVLAAALMAAADAALLATHTSPEHANDPDAVREGRERAHRALAMGRVVAYLLAGAALVTPLGLATMADPNRTLASILAAVAIVGLSEGVSRAIGAARPLAVSAALGPVRAVTALLLRPAVEIGSLLERGLYTLLPPRPVDEEGRETSADRFREVVAAEAEISSAEEDLIHGVFSMGDTEVREVMVPRVDIIGIEVESPWSEAVDRVRSSEHARLPVYDGTLDNITGVLYAKDLLADAIADEPSSDDWQRLVRPAEFIPTSKRIDEQLREFQAAGRHMAIVVDEYGGTAGLVTIEDILEEIVGEIRDEHDVEDPDVLAEGNDRFWVAGRVGLDDLSEWLGVELSREHITTVGGLVYDLFARVPRAGESLEHLGFRLVVERVRRRRIERVYFERLEAGVPAQDRTAGEDR
jgi:putative hemolysin